MANWAQLIPDLLTLIAKKVELYEDFVAFRGVCRSWRSAAAKNNFCRVQQQQVPWLLLAGRGDSRDFYSLTKGGMVHSVYLPEAKGKRIISSLGWLITIDIDGEVELLHPLSRCRIPLPGVSKCSHFDTLDMDPIIMLKRAAFSASPSDDEAYTLMALICYKLAYWRPGNNAWITVETPEITINMIEEVVYFGGQFYAMDCQGQLFSIDISNKTANIVGRIPLDIMDNCYLVDSGDGHMIVVLREILFDDERYMLAGLREILYGEDDDDNEAFIYQHELVYTNMWGTDNYWTNSFRLFKFDSSYDCHPINDLGEGRSLFLGQCAPVFVSVGGGSIFIRPNCIYFTYDAYDPYFDDNDNAERGGRDMGVYSLQKQEFIKDGAPMYQGNKGRSPLCPLLWVVPSF